MMPQLPRFVIPFSLLLTSCTTVHLPLCEDLARTTYDHIPAMNSEVGRYTEEVAKQMHLNIIVLSPFVMAVHGNLWSIHRFEEDYPTMVCGFDPLHVTVPRDTYLRCMDHVNDWIAVVRSDQPENLMLTQNEYAATCATGAARAH